MYIKLLFLNLDMEQMLVDQKAGNNINGLLNVAKAHGCNAGGG